MTVTQLYGLTIASELPLHQARILQDSPAVDLELIVGGAADHGGEPAGRVLLHLQADRQYYTATETSDGYLLRFYGTCDVTIRADLSRATFHLHDGADPAIVSVLAAGTVLAFILALRGAAVLHASAVQIGDQALAFVGASGMGKSTMATLMCADGASLITDDLLRLDVTQTPPRCSLGATELRLRKAAGDLAARFEAAPARRSTGDARDALAVPRSSAEGLPLKAIVIPGPDHSGTRSTPEILPLDPMRAFLLLSQFPRLLGWQDETILRRHFQQLGDIIERVPVLVAKLPWGPPFQHDIASAVREAVGLESQSLQVTT